MCIKKEPREVLQPLAELVEELINYEHIDVRSLPWGGVAAFNALVENV